MSQYLTSTGFLRPSYDEIRRRLESEIKIAFGAGVDLTAPGPFGQLIASQAKWLNDLYELAQEFHSSRDPDGASGVSLDEVCADVGIYRLPATAARVGDLVLWGTYGASFTVAAGSKVKSSVQPMAYSLESDVAFGTGPFRGVRLSLGTISTSDVVSVTLDGVAYTHTVVGGETKADVIQALATTINAGAFAGEASLEVVTGTSYLRIEHSSFALSAYSAHLTPREEAHSGIVVADSVGTQPVPALTLDTIMTPVAGWLSIEQPASGQDGTDVESDSSLRIRRMAGLRSGTATITAITEALYRVNGVATVAVASNDTDSTDAEGRPPHSVEAVVTGGDSAAIFQSLYSTVAGGIATHGNTSGTVVGLDGKAHPVSYSVPVAKYAWVEVTIVSTDPDGGPATGYQDAIAQAIEAYGNSNFAPGANFILQKMYAPIYSIPGIYSVTLRIATTASAGGPPTYGTANIAIALREYLDFSADRVAFV